MRTLLYALMIAATLCGVARAESEPFPLPTDNRLVVFNYSPDQTYTVLSLPGTVTHIELGADEEVAQQPAIGDSVQWQLSGGGRHLFVKPSKNDLFTSLTVVTSRRAYQMTLRSGPPGGKWYQRVSWRYPEVIAARKAVLEASEVAARREAERMESLVAGSGIEVERLNFNYAIEGEAAFRPTTVFDDGRFTWIRLPKASQEMPALFVPEDGQAALVNFTLKGDFMVVQRTAPRFVLKLGKDEVRVSAGGKSAGSSLLNWFKSN